MGVKGKVRGLPGWSFIGLLVVLTLVHGTVASVRPKADPAAGSILVSTLNVGDTVAPAVRSTLTSLPSRRREGRSTQCTLVVLFDAECPHCRQAAHDLDEVAPDRLTAITAMLWVTDTRASVENIRAAGLPEHVPALFMDDAFERFKIQAIPAGFWIDDAGVVARVWPFRTSAEDLAVPEPCQALNHP